MISLTDKIWIDLEEHTEKQIRHCLSYNVWSGIAALIRGQISNQADNTTRYEVSSNIVDNTHKSY